MKTTRLPWLIAISLASACSTILDEPWQLDHDRIIAVRATPPRILAGQTAQLDVLVGTKGAPVREQLPDAAMVASPRSLADALVGSVVTAPDDSRLAKARSELALSAGAPVPLVIAISAGGFAATKTVWLGDSGDNPALIDLRIAGAMPPMSLVVPRDEDVPLSVQADDVLEPVNWLTSCGTMHDFDLSSAYLRVEPDDPQEGELAIVLRDSKGGVTWRVWPIRAE